MANLTVSTVIDGLMQATTADGAAHALGLGQADSPTFAGFTQIGGQAPVTDSTYVFGSSSIQTISGVLVNIGQAFAPFADGVYTVGLGVTQNGTITIQSGIITAIQQAA